MDLQLLEMLGAKRNIPKVNFTDYCGILIAPPKFGKTTIASLYPKAIICAFEKGYNAQVANVVDTPTWDDFIKFVDKLENNRQVVGDNVKTIVLDTVNEAHDKCGAYALKTLSRLDQKKYVKPTDVPYGGYYTELDKQFKLQIDRLLKLGFMPLYLTHNKIKNVKPKNGEAYDIYVSTMSERCEKIVYPAVDYIIHGERRKVVDTLGNAKMTRVLVIKGNEVTEAGGRVYIDGDIQFDNEEEAMTKFQAQFRKGIEEKLRKAGITDSVEDLSKKQEEEKKAEVEEYIKTSKVPSNEELVEQIKGKFPTATEVAKVELQKFMGEKGITSFVDPSQVSSENLQAILKILS